MLSKQRSRPGGIIVDETERQRWSSEASRDFRASSASCLVAFAGATAVCTTLSMVWLRAGIGPDAKAYEAGDLPVLVLPVMLAATIAAVAALVGAATGARHAVSAAAVAGGIVIALTAPVILILETVASAIPDSLLPATARRLAVDVGAGPGLWIALLGGLVILASTAARKPPFLSSLSAVLKGGRAYRALPALLLLLATCLFGWLRYEPWVIASTFGSSDDLAGWSLPWIGPLSLVALGLLAAALAAASLLQLQLAGLLAAGGGWLVTFLTAIVAKATSGLARLRFDELTPDRVRGYSPHVELAPATWIAFGTGIAAAAAGAGLLLVAGASREGAWATS